MKASALFLLFAAFSFTALQAEDVSSPEVHADGTVTFRLLMPSAQKVDVELEVISGAVTIPMTKDASGMWSAASAALTPDVYTYEFVVDGQRIIDPGVRTYVPNHLDQGGLFTVPRSPAAIWEQTDVPHGAVSHHFYYSKISGTQQDYFVYTPPGFDRRSRKQYPVLYLLHGYSDFSDAWIAVGQANFILDNLIAQGQAKAAIVVMPPGYSVPAVLKVGYPPDKSPLWSQNLGRFPEMLLTEVMPQVEAEFPVRKDRNNRAIAGLSMGGAEAVSTGLNHVDQFAWVEAMSAALPDDFAAAYPHFDASQGHRIKLFIACGKLDPFYRRNQDFQAWLTSKGIAFTTVETDGAHTWQVWRRNLAELLPKLFQ
jgi:enterochelin esterase family protein